MTSPTWLRAQEVSARAVWNARSEQPGPLADRLAAHLASADRLLGGEPRWLVDDDDEAVTADSDDLTQVVARRVYRDAEQEAFPRLGYEFSLRREGPAGFLRIRLRVGVAVNARRMPANSVSVLIAGPMQEGRRLSIDSSLADGVLRGLVQAWEPASAAVFDDAALIAMEGRGKFSPLVGQRAWISDRIGNIAAATSGVDAARETEERTCSLTMLSIRDQPPAKCGLPCKPTTCLTLPVLSADGAIAPLTAIHRCTRSLDTFEIPRASTEPEGRSQANTIVASRVAAETGGT